MGKRANFNGDIIYCLVGPSGSGKTTVAKELEQRGYNVIKSYTTRPPREPEEWGHIFVDSVSAKEGVLALTLYDGYHYWARREQYQGKGKSIYVIDPEGVEVLRKTVADTQVVVIYLNATETECFARMLVRLHEKYGIKTPPEYYADKDMAERRLEHDRKLFRVVPCDYAIDANGTIAETVENVLEVIRS